MTLERLRELEKAATPGPWRAAPNGGGPDADILREDSYPVAYDREGLTGCVIRGEDAALIAAARNALPDLLAVVEAARHYFQRVDETRDLEDGSEAMLRWAAEEYRLETALRAALERLDR